MKQTVVILLLTAALSACGGGGGDDLPAQKTNDKTIHQGLKVQNLQLSYSANQRLQVSVQGKVGQLSYQLNEPNTDILLLQDNQLYIQNAGETGVTVKDSGNATTLGTESQFMVKVLPAARGPLLVNDLLLKPGEAGKLSISGVKGTLNYQLPESQSNVSLNAGNGEVKAFVPGEVTLQVSDDGGRNYQAAEAQLKIIVSQPDGEFAKVLPLAPKPFVEGAQLQPMLQGEPLPESWFRVADGAAQDVVQLNPRTGAMAVMHAGKTRIELIQPGRYSGEAANVQGFDVTINQAQNTELALEQQEWAYAPYAEVSLLARGNKGQVSYQLLAGDDVVTLESANGDLKLLGAGSASIRVQDSGDRDYGAAEITLPLTILKGTSQQLSVADIYHSFSNDRLCLQVQQARGKLEYALSPGAATDVISLQQDGCFDMLKAGEVSVTVTDSGDDNYHPAKAQANIQISKALNTELKAQTLNFAKAEDQLLAPLVTGAKGLLSYSFDAGVTALKQEADGSIRVVGSGYAVVKVHDAGNDQYQAAETSFTVNVGAMDGTLRVEPVTTVFAPGKLVPVNFSGVLGQLSGGLSAGSANDVAELNLATGQIKVLNAGITYFTVTDSGDATHRDRSVSLRVTVTKAPAKMLSFSQSQLLTEYGQAQLLPPTLDGVVSGSSIKYLPEPYGQDVVDLNSVSGSMQVKNAGSLKVTATASHRNYEDAIASFDVKVSPAPYPGDYPQVEKDEQPAFFPGISVESGRVKAPYGKVTHEITQVYNPKEMAITADDKLLLVALPESHPISMSVTDDGGRNYLPGTLTYSVFLQNPQPGSGEEQQLSFNGAELSVSSLATVANGDEDKSYFLLQEFNKRAKAVEGKDYSLLSVRVKNDKGQVGLATLRASRSGKCADGSLAGGAIEKPLLKFASCPAQVTLSLHPEDGYNGSLPAGHYSAAEPLILVHYAPAYEPGAVVAANNNSPRAWWLIQVDLTL